MRNFEKLFLAVVCLFAAVPAWAQRTLVSGTVTDPSGVPYSGATMVATLTTPAGVSGVYLQGAQITGSTQRVTLDNTGSFLMNLADNNVTLCANAQGVLGTCVPLTQWVFTVTLSPGVAPPVGTGPQTFSTTLTITGASQSISAALSGASAKLLTLTSSAFNGVNQQAGNYTAVAGDNGKLIRMTGGGTFTLPNPAPSNWSVWLINGASTLTQLIISTNGLNMNGSTSGGQIMGGGMAEIFSDGTQYFAPFQLLMSGQNVNPCFFYNGNLTDFAQTNCVLANFASSVFTVPTNVSISGPLALNGNPKGRLLLQDQGQCTMAAGACTAQSLGSTYAAAPLCFLTWTGTGTLTGILKVASTTTTVTPSSSVGTDTAQVNWACLGN